MTPATCEPSPPQSARGSGCLCVRIAPATTSADWEAVHTLTRELVTWIGETLGVDIETAQASATAEFEHLQRYYEFPGAVFLLGRLHGEPAAISGVHLLTPDIAELKRMWVTPAARGHGISSQLLETAIAAARTLGASHLRLETEPTVMARAYEMYCRHGFREVPPYTNLSDAVPGVVALERRL